MSDVLAESLFKKQNKQFERMDELAKAFSANYCGSTIVRDSVFEIVSNYARKRELLFEILRYPFKDDELWAFTFVKKGTIFMCINTDLAMCKQIFAVAHELYHIQCYAEDIDQNTIAGGSLLDAKTTYEAEASQEDLEANAFAGLLLMPDSTIDEQIKMYGISEENISVDDILTLMNLFALPYKAVVLRLVENRNITEATAHNLLEKDPDDISRRIELTGKAWQWQQRSNRLLHYGSLLLNMEYNLHNGLLTENREQSDGKYLDKIRKYFCKES